MADQTNSDQVTSIECYVRYDQENSGPGIFGIACFDMDAIVDCFVGDKYSVCAMKLCFGARGQLLSSEDITNEVIDELRDRIKAGTYNDCPHPVMESEFKKWRQQDHDEMATAGP